MRIFRIIVSLVTSSFFCENSYSSTQKADSLFNLKKYSESKILYDSIFYKEKLMKIYNYVIILLIGLFVSSCNEADENNLSNNINNEKKINIKMAAAFPSSLIILGETGLKLSKKINEISSGNINIKYFEPGALVPPMEIFDAVSIL